MTAPLFSSVLLVISLLAPFLGGCAYTWEKGLILLAMGATVWFFPPKSFFNKKLFILFSGLLLLPLLAFLPAEWFGIPEWRKEILETLGISLPQTLTPQPWVTLDTWFFYSAVLLWSYYLLQQSWTNEQRRYMVSGVALGISSIALFSIIAYSFGWRPGAIWANPISPDEKKYLEVLGPFPSRNQSANVFALGLVLLCGPLFDAIKKKGGKKLIFWLLVALPLILALVLGKSRAGILLAAGGVGIWLLGLSIYIGSLKRLIIGGSIVLLLIALYLSFAEGSMARFKQSDNPLQSGRTDIYQDAVQMIKKTPLIGVGLGNFSNIFPFYQKKSFSDMRAHHPESDLLWFGAEVGLLALLLLGGLILLLIFYLFPFSDKPRRKRRDQRFRIAASAASATFLIHAFVDVSAHSLGSFLPAILVFSLAFPEKSSEENQNPRFAKPIHAFSAFFILFVGAISFLISCGVIFPSRAGAEKLAKKAAEETGNFNYAQSYLYLTKALKWRPMEWRYYYLRAVCTIKGRLPKKSAISDFRFVRFLEPGSASLVMAEAKVWLEGAPYYAFPAWREALRRDATRRHENFFQMIAAIQEHPKLRKPLFNLALAYPSLHIHLLSRCPAKEYPYFLERVLNKDPYLNEVSAEDRVKILEQWYQKGDKEALIKKLLTREEWRAAAWKTLAKDYVKKEKFEDAFKILKTYFKQKPKVASMRFSKSDTLEKLQTKYILDPTSIYHGVRLYGMQNRKGKKADALITLNKMLTLPDHPAYLYFFKAQLLEEKAEDWKEVWETMWKYVEKN